MQTDLQLMVHLFLFNLSLLANLSSFLPGVAVGFAAVAMARSHRRRHTAVVIGAFALAGLAAGTLVGFLFMPTPEEAGHLAGAALLAGVIAASIWEVARKPQTE